MMSSPDRRIPADTVVADGRMVAPIFLPSVSLWTALGSDWRPKSHALSLRIDQSRPRTLQQSNDIYRLENDDKMPTCTSWSTSRAVPMSCTALEMRSDAENDIQMKVGAAADDPQTNRHVKRYNCTMAAQLRHVLQDIMSRRVAKKKQRAGCVASCVRSPRRTMTSRELVKVHLRQGASDLVCILVSRLAFCLETRSDARVPSMSGSARRFSKMFSVYDRPQVCSLQSFHKKPSTQSRSIVPLIFSSFRVHVAENQ